MPTARKLRREAHPQHCHGHSSLLIHLRHERRAARLQNLAALCENRRHAHGCQHLVGLEPHTEVVVVEAIKRHVGPKRNLRLDQAGEILAVLAEFPISAEKPRRSSDAVTDTALLRRSEEGAIGHGRRSVARQVPDGSDIDVDDRQRPHVWHSPQEAAPIVRLREGCDVPIKEAMHHKLGLKILLRQHGARQYGQRQSARLVEGCFFAAKAFPPNGVIEILRLVPLEALPAQVEHAQLSEFWRRPPLVHLALLHLLRLLVLLLCLLLRLLLRLLFLLGDALGRFGFGQRC
mmetsp:Transcript_88217/g.248297  ORF Transcript_88217/g.248297 Transcript_88217/m.248297 type:complete len:290 (-) Transcript_88217:711-1580(-)